MEDNRYEKIIRHGPREVKRVAITFDDGPDDQYTPQVLAILKKHLVKATFFVTGEMCKKYPEMLDEILQEGHVLGNHSWDHKKLPEYPIIESFFQLGATNAVVSQCTKRRMRLFRPPYGSINNDELASLYAMGIFVVNWDVDTRDWDRKVTATEIFETIRRDTRSGSVILMHSVPWILADRLVALEEIIQYVQNELECEFTTVDELLEIPAYFSNRDKKSLRHHIVQPKETLTSISHKYKVSVKQIVEMNCCIKDPDVIIAGEKLIIP